MKFLLGYNMKVVISFIYFVGWKFLGGIFPGGGEWTGSGGRGEVGVGGGGGGGG